MSIIGHDKEKEIFSNILRDDRLHHAYIFSGREGSGKKMFAKQIAKSLLCEDRTFLESCDCKHCKLSEESTHPDIHIIEESPIKIETSRKITENAFMSPLSGRNKIYIIDNAHTFTIPAANALLKTLEEPPEDTHFFLITERFEQIMPTIRSRSIHIRFSSLTNEEVAEILTEKGEHPQNAEKAASMSSGSVTYAKFLIETISETGEFSPSLDKKELFADIQALDTKEKIRAYCASLFTYMFEEYKKNGRETLLDFSNYLLAILRRLEYNVSLDIFRLDLYTKTVEVFSEKS
jgi:DNA polymerase-3 subunit delta'